MQQRRRVFIAWGFAPNGEDAVIHCGEWDTVEAAMQAVASQGLELAEVETEWRAS